jgi:hypothetical protein
MNRSSLTTLDGVNGAFALPSVHPTTPKVVGLQVATNDKELF